MSGYSEAVENMAYVIDQLSMQTLDPIINEHGPMPPESASRLMTDEDNEKWQDVERVAGVVCTTYEVDYDDFMNDVAGSLLQNLLATELGVQ